MASEPQTSLMIVRVVWFVLGLAIMAPVGYYVGTQGQARKEADITISMQEKVLDIHTDIYGNLPRNRDDVIKQLYDYAD